MVRLLPLVLVVGACDRAPPPPPAPGVPGDDRYAPPVYRDAGTMPDAFVPKYRDPSKQLAEIPAMVGVGTKYLVASSRNPATRAGADVLAAGGNAVDAAIAAAFALEVTEPVTGFALVRTGKAQARVLELGSVEGLALLHRDHGKAPWASLAKMSSSASHTAPRWLDPLRFRYRGRTVVTVPPPSAGGIVLAMTAGLLASSDLGALAWHGAEHVHRVVEAWKRAFAARASLLAAPTTLAAKLAPPALADQAKAITATATPAADITAPVSRTPTVAAAAVDASGLAVVIVLAGASTDAPSLAPAIVENVAGDVELVLAPAGGPEGVTASWQALSNLVDFGHRPGLAVAHGRFHHEQVPDTLFVEADALDEATSTALAAQGHALDWKRAREQFGAVIAIARTPEGWTATVDPRHGGAATGDRVR